MNAVAQLVALSQSFQIESMSADTVAAARRAVLDSLGCAIAAIGCEPVRVAGPLIHGGSDRATVIGEAGISTLERAVLLNGILLRYLDMMDVYWAKDVCHPSENVPVALASVETIGGSGARLIEAVVAGYEAQMRLTHAVSLQSMGMHHVTAGGIVAPLVMPGRRWTAYSPCAWRRAALPGRRIFLTG